MLEFMWSRRLSRSLESSARRHFPRRALDLLLLYLRGL